MSNDNSESLLASGAPADREDLLETWRDRLDDVPDLRMTKVLRVRRAIATNSYDESAILDKALPTIQLDLEPIGAVDSLDEL